MGHDRGPECLRRIGLLVVLTVSDILEEAVLIEMTGIGIVLLVVALIALAALALRSGSDDHRDHSSSSPN
jgi:hypothetical protein